MSQVPRLRSVDHDERDPNRSAKDHVQGIIGRALKAGKPLTELSLREEGKERLAMINDAREELARLAGIALVQKDSESETGTAEGVSDDIEKADRDLRIRNIIIEPFNALPEDYRTFNGRVYTGEEVAAALPDQELVLEEMDLIKGDLLSLGIDKLGRILLSMNRKQQGDFPERYSYAHARSLAKRFVYKGMKGYPEYIRGDRVDKWNGEIRFNGLDIPQSAILIERGLIEHGEVNRLPKEQILRTRQGIWIESGSSRKNPSTIPNTASIAYLSEKGGLDIRDWTLYPRRDRYGRSCGVVPTANMVVVLRISLDQNAL